MTTHARAWLRYVLALCSHYSGLDWLYRRAGGAGLVILMLHRLRDEPDPYPLSLSRPQLRQMVRWLRGRRALVGLDDGLRGLVSASPRVNYAITFDDVTVESRDSAQDQVVSEVIEALDAHLSATAVDAS